MNEEELKNEYLAITTVIQIQGKSRSYIPAHHLSFPTHPFTNPLGGSRGRQSSSPHPNCKYSHTTVRAQQLYIGSHLLKI